MPLSLTTNPVLRMQELVAGKQTGRGNMFAVGSALYYVMLAQVGPAGGTNALSVWKSTDKTTWVLMATYAAAGPPLQTNSSAECPCALVGTIIYIAGTLIDTTGFPAQISIVLHRFDTASDTFLSDSAASAIISQVVVDTWSISALNDGRLLVSYTTGPAPIAVSFSIAPYTPGTDTWAATVALTVAPLGDLVVQQIHDPLTDLTFVFYNVRGTGEIRCATLTSALAFTDVTAITPSIVYGSSLYGIAAISAGEVVFPTLASGGLKVARSPAQATPSFTVDLVQDNSGLPAGLIVSQYDNIVSGGWACQDIGGLLYLFYDVDNGNLDNASSQCWLYYQSSTGPGVWSAPLIAFTSVIPGEPMVPYGTKIPGFDPVILVGVVDPTTYDAVASLTNFILFPLGGPPLVLADSPPTGQVGTAYAHCFVASGGTAPYTFAITSGSLPPGLALGLSTGCVTGTPTTMGTFCFTVTVTDAAAATASVAACITIYGAVLIELIGWKLYPDQPCEDTVEGLEVPQVDRAV